MVEQNEYTVEIYEPRLTDTDILNIENLYPKGIVNRLRDDGVLSGDTLVGYHTENGNLVEKRISQGMSEKDAIEKHYKITSHPTFQDWEEKPSFLTKTVGAVGNVIDTIIPTEREKAQEIEREMENLLDENQIKAIDKGIAEEYKFPVLTSPFPRKQPEVLGSGRLDTMKLSPENVFYGGLHDGFIQPMYSLYGFLKKHQNKMKPLSELNKFHMTDEEEKAYKQEAHIYNMELANEMDNRMNTFWGQTSEENYQDKIFEISGVDIGPEAANYLANAKTFKGSVAKVLGENIAYLATFELIASRISAGNQKMYKEALEYMKSKEGKLAMNKSGDPAEVLIKWAKDHVFVNKNFNKAKAQKFFSGVTRYSQTLKTTEAEKLIKLGTDRIIGIQKNLDDALLKKDYGLVNILENKVAKQTEYLAKLRTGMTNTSNLSKVMANEFVSSSCGGGLYNVMGSEGWQVVGELACGFTSPAIMAKAGKVTQTAGEIGATVVDKTSDIVDSIIPFFDLTTNMRAKVFGGDYTELYRYERRGDKTVYRALNNKEIRAMRKFVATIDTLPPGLRDETLTRMQSTYQDLKDLTKNMGVEDASLVNLTVADLSNLAMLHGLEQISQASVNIHKVDKYNIAAAQERLNKMGDIGNVIQANIAKITKKNPDLINDGSFAKWHNSVLNHLSENQKFMSQAAEDHYELILSKGENLKLKWAEKPITPNEMSIEFSAWYDELKEFSKNTQNVEIKGNIDLILKDEVWKEDILHMITGVNIKLNNDTYSTLYKGKGLAKVDIEKLKTEKIKRFEDVVPNVNRALAFTFEAWKGFKKLEYKHAYNNLDTAAKGNTVDITESFDNVWAQLTKEEPDLTLHKMTAKIPSTSSVKPLLKIFDVPATREIKRYITNPEGKETISLLAKRMMNDTKYAGKKIDFSDEFFEALLKPEMNNADISKVTTEFKQAMARIEDVKSRSINNFDLFNFLRRDEAADLKLELTFEEAMEFKSGLFKYEAEAFSKNNTNLGGWWMSRKNDIDLALRNKSKDLGIEELYNTANQNRLEYALRFERKGTKGNDWSQVRNKHTKDGKKINDADAEQMALELDGGKTGDFSKSLNINSVEHKINPSNWITPKYIDNILNNPDEAKIFKGELERLFGKYDPDNAKLYSTSESGFYFDLSDPSTLKMVHNMRAILTRKFTNYIANNTSPGILMSEAILRKNIPEWTIIGKKGKALDTKKLQEFEDIFTITNSKGDNIKLFDTLVAQDLATGFDTFAQKTEQGAKAIRRLNSQLNLALLKGKEVIKRGLKQKELFMEGMQGADVLARFKTEIINEKIFVENVVKRGKFEDLVFALKETGTVTKKNEESFRLFAKELTAKYMSENFEEITGVQKVLQKESIWTTTARKLTAPRKTYTVVHQKQMKAQEFIKFITENRQGLEQIFSPEELNNLDKMINLTMKLGGGASIGSKGFKGIPSTMSVESWISRFYSINRDIISPKYVATESILQRMRLNSMSLLIETIRDPKLAELVIKTLETGNPLNKIENKYVMDMLTASVIEATIAKEIASGTALESDDFVGEQLENLFGKKYLLPEKETIVRQ